MVVTVLSIIGMQSPKTDIMITGNGKISAQAQQLANLGVMEAKNWLSLHYKADAIPLNAGNGDELFIVVRPTITDTSIEDNFSRAGILSDTAAAINFTADDGTNITNSNFNSPDNYTDGLGKAMTASDYTLKDSDTGDTIATYKWNIIRISQVGAIFDATVSEAKAEDVLAAEPSITSKFSDPVPVTEGYNAAIGEDKAFWQYFYIKSSANSDGLVAEAEGIASYKQIIPSSD